MFCPTGTEQPTAEETNDCHPDYMRRLASLSDLVPTERVFVGRFRYGTICNQGFPDVNPFCLSQEGSLFWGTREEEEGTCAKEDGEQSFLSISIERMRSGIGSVSQPRLTRMKIHAQPCFPPIPSMPEIAAASSPEKAPS